MEVYKSNHDSIFIQNNKESMNSVQIYLKLIINLILKNQTYIIFNEIFSDWKLSISRIKSVPNHPIHFVIHFLWYFDLSVSFNFELGIIGFNSD
jgi:hypothetical protein